MFEVFARIPEFYADAKANQQLYRGVLRDLPSRGFVVPQDFNPELSMKQLLARYSPIEKQSGQGGFTVLDFRVGPFRNKLLGQFAADHILIAVQSGGALFGGGALLRYGIEAEKSVSFRDVIFDWKS